MALSVLLSCVGWQASRQARLAQLAQAQAGSQAGLCRIRQAQTGGRLRQTGRHAGNQTSNIKSMQCIAMQCNVMPMVCLLDGVSLSAAYYFT